MSRLLEKTLEFKERAAELDREMAEFVAWCHALHMAYVERTGEQPTARTVYLDIDEQRADEILTMLPREGA